MSNKINKLSVFLSLVLRHKPEVINIKLDKNGYADVNELINNICKSGGRYIDFEILEQIVKEDDKQRYSFNIDKTKIRANQGHSIKVDVEFEEVEPPETLLHGTATRFIDSILEKGIVKMNRLYVHLSDNIGVATKVGSRHVEVAILKINSKKMYKDGYKFYLSKNGVWLTDHIPTKYISIKEGDLL